MFPYETLRQKLLADLSEACAPVKESLPHGSDLPPDWFLHDQPGVWSDDLTPVLCASLHASFLKKLAPGGLSKSADEAARIKFLNRLPLVGLKEPSVYGDDYLLGLFHCEMDRVLGCGPDDLTLEQIGSRFKAGPGASLKQNFGSFFHKYFQGPLSFSSKLLLDRFRAALMYQPTWALAEMQRFQEFGVVIEDTSSAFFAKKNVEESRFCCTEPGGNMLFQQALGALICDRLESIGIDLKVQQSINRYLAQIGSVTDDLVTIDLTSASDSISVELCEKYVPRPFWLWMKLCRTSYTRMPDGTRVLLPMVSTMGNGFTFPLQTAIFACIVRAAYQAKGLTPPPGNSEWGVNGDDIIVRKDLSVAVRRLLYLLGFEVNVKKTFDSGPFRESCGGDYYRGHNIRGVYIKSLETASERFSAINRLNLWSARHGILLKRTVRFLLSKSPNWQKFVVPRAQQDDAGVKVASYHAGGRRYYRALVAEVSKHEIPYGSGEYLGYNLGLYVSMLEGGCKSVDEPISTPLDIALRDLAWPDGPPDEVHPPLIIPMREKGATVMYRSRSLPVNWWDWNGLTTVYPDCWEAVVSLHLDF